MKFHTFICGTSKSKNEEGYYIKEKDKFWRAVYEAGLTENQFSPFAYKEFEAKGFKFTEIVNPEKNIISQDKFITLSDVESGLQHLNGLIKTYEPKRILFHGKKSADWFIRYLLGLKIKSTKSYTITKDLDYGLQEFKFLDIDIYILPSTSGAASKYWDILPWIEAFKDCKTAIEQSS